MSVSIRQTIQKTLESILPASMYNSLHAAVTKRRARRWAANPQPYLAETLEQFAPVGGVVMDIGANLGQWAVHMSRRVGKDGLVHAYEPVPNFMTVFRKTMHDLDVHHNIRFHQLALSDQQGEMSFATHDKDGKYLSGAAHISKPGEKGDITVPVVTLDSLLDTLERAKEIRFLKVDVEGAELMLFKGGTRFIKELRPVIFSEVEDRHCSGFGHTRQDVIDFMTSLGYDHKPVTHNDVLFTPKA
ncbi:MAG: FkbM family methyltransferase [Phycisphaerales bacterium]|nr:FkbM family methyltransferase [Phycisphaerales bacterium]